MSASTTTSSNLPDGGRFSVLWLSVFALLAALALLFAFQRVVHAAVDKAQADRLHQSDQAQALWQCNQLAARAERRACTAALVGASRTVRLPDVLVSTTQ